MIRRLIAGAAISIPALAILSVQGNAKATAAVGAGIAGSNQGACSVAAGLFVFGMLADSTVVFAGAGVAAQIAGGLLGMAYC